MSDTRLIKPVLVRATIDGHMESFWATPLPEEAHFGIVGNALGNGAISYGDLVEWNDEGDVIAVRARSDRATLVLWIEADSDDLATAARWAQACEDAAAAWTRQGMVVEGGAGMLIVSFVVTDLARQCAEMIAVVAKKGQPLRAELGPVPDSPMDAESLGLGLPEPWEPDDQPDPSTMPPLADTLLADVVERDLVSRLKAQGHLHPDIDDGELLGCAVRLLEIDYRCYHACALGRNDQVLVLAGRDVSMRMGLLLAPLPGYVFDTDFLRE